MFGYICPLQFSKINHLDLMLLINGGFLLLLLTVILIKTILEIICNKFNICYNKQ